VGFIFTIYLLRNRHLESILREFFNYEAHMQYFFNFWEVNLWFLALKYNERQMKETVRLKNGNISQIKPGLKW